MERYNLNKTSKTRSSKTTIILFGFVEGYKTRLVTLSLHQHICFIKIYVDDLNQGGDVLPYGTVYSNGKLYRPGQGWTGRAHNGQRLSRIEMESIEAQSERTALEEHTDAEEEEWSANVFQQIANEIMPRSIKMVADTPNKHQSNMLPILDTEMAVKNGRFIHRHYAKPMSSLEVTLCRSAMSTASKVSILTQEGSRRLRNCSLEMEWKDKIIFINRLMVSMMWGGYGPKLRELVSRRIIARYDMNISNYKELGRPLYRSLEDRRMHPKPDKGSWFRSDGSTATFMVPSTPGSKLAKIIRHTLETTEGPRGTKTKVVEKPGCKLMTGLAMNNLFPRQSCQRPNCPLDKDGKCLEKCMKEGINYTAKCTRCTELLHLYTGESSRTLYTRALQHYQDYSRAMRNKDQDHRNSQEPSSSWMMDHTDNVHPGTDMNKSDYEFSLITTYRDPLTRQIAEAIRINEALEYNKYTDNKGEIIEIRSLNRKGEHFAPRERWDGNS